jgi:hypothetical protein
MVRKTAQERQAEVAAEAVNREEQRQARMATAPLKMLKIQSLVTSLMIQGVHITSNVTGFAPDHIKGDKDALRLQITIDDRQYLDYEEEKLLYLDTEEWEFDVLFRTLQDIQEKLDVVRREYDLAKSARDKLTPEELAAFKKHVRTL